MKYHDGCTVRRSSRGSPRSNGPSSICFPNSKPASMPFCRSPLPLAAGISISVHQQPERAASKSNAVSSRRFGLPRAWDSGRISPVGAAAADWRLRIAARCFVTAEQCKSDAQLKGKAKAHRETGAPFSFRETGFFRKNLTATRNYGVVGDIPTQNGSELLPAIGRWSNPTNAISDALTLTQHQRKVTTRFSRGACHEI